MVGRNDDGRNGSYDILLSILIGRERPPSLRLRHRGSYDFLSGDFRLRILVLCGVMAVGFCGLCCNERVNGSLCCNVMIPNHPFFPV